MSATESHAGEFFAIDSRQWARVCDAGMNEACAYLVLARGTGPENRITRWSAEAVHRHSGVAWSRARAAVEKLVRAGLIRRGKDYTKERPRYELMPYERTKFEINENFIWLPNTIVTGTKTGETSPLARIRGAGDRWALRLLVDLYAAQNLREDGGINPAFICESYERKEVGERGIYVIWGFKQGTKALQWEGPLAAHRNRPKEGEVHPAWGSLKLLKQTGLLTYIPHLYESSSPQAEPIHAYGINRDGEEQIETEIGVAADTAGREMVPEWDVQKAENDGFEWFCPAPRTLPGVQLVGVARLRYRPHTKRTAAWYANLQESGQAAIVHYSKIACGEQSDLLRIRQA